MKSVVVVIGAGTPDEAGHVGALLMGPDGAFITGSDVLMDGGVTAAYWFGELASKLGPKDALRVLLSRPTPSHPPAARCV